MLSRIQCQMTNVIAGAAQHTMAQFGVAHKNGNLVLDEAKLSAAIAADPDKLDEVLGKPGTGLAAQFTAKVTQQLGADGVLADQTGVVQGHVDTLTAQRRQVIETLSREASLQAL